MRLDELVKPTPKILAMDVTERHEWLKFIYKWLSGSYMNKTDPGLLRRWQQFAKMFPPKVPGQINLFRLVTVPVRYAKEQHFSFKPAKVKASSWTRTLVGLDAVAGVARDFKEFDSQYPTARIGIEATIPGHLVLATPVSIRNAFMMMSHDYPDRYKETEYSYVKNGVTYGGTKFPGFPGEEDPEKSDFSMYDVYTLHDVLNRPGGHYRQYEYIVQTPPKVNATVVQLYRVGAEDLRMGNDDPGQPHIRPPRITRMK